MRRSLGVWALAAGLVAGLGLRGEARAQEPPKPTDEHKLLRQEVGTWEATIKTWADPKGEPMESKGTETNRLLPGGLFLISQFRGEFGGQTFHGHGTTGYDTNKKKYVGTWIDSMTTGTMTIEGTYDADRKELTMTGESVGPDGKTAEMKNVTAMTGKDSRVFTMYMRPKGETEWVRFMEITYKKVASPSAKKAAPARP